MIQSTSKAAIVLGLALLAVGIIGGTEAWAADSPALSDAALEEDLKSLDDLDAVDGLDDLDDLEEDGDLTQKEPAPEGAWDPMMGWNRRVYRFNDRLYYGVMKPVAEGYRKVVPLVARTGVKNFFYNLAMPIRFVNALLQLKGQRANAEMARFFFNSTAGVLGFGNPARHYPELNPPPEDTGQTLGFWGIGPGPYIVWPFLGPSTLRDSFGLAGDYALYPVSYSRSIFFSVGVSLYSIVNQTSLTIGEYEAIQEAAIDPYIAIREAFVDNRKKRVEE